MIETIPFHHFIRVLPPMSSGTNSLKPMMLSQLQSAMAHSYDVPLQLINDKGLVTSGYTGNIPYLSVGYQLLLCYFSSYFEH